MNRGTAKNISERVMETLRSLEDELGVTFSQGNGSYDSATFSMKIKATIDSVDGSTQTPEMVDFEKQCFRFGFEPSDLGKTFTHAGDTYKIVGLKSKSRKYPILGEDAQGKTFKFTANLVLDGMGKARVPTYLGLTR